jgi:hypothetical protein
MHCSKDENKSAVLIAGKTEMIVDCSKMASTVGLQVDSARLD